MIAAHLKNFIYIECLKFFRTKNFIIAVLLLAVCACVILIDFHLRIHEKFARYVSFNKDAIFVIYYLKNLSPKLGTISYLVPAVFALLIWEMEHKVLPAQIFFRSMRNASLLVFAKFSIVMSMSILWLAAAGMAYGWLIHKEFPVDYPLIESYRLMFRFGIHQLYYSGIIALLFFVVLSLFRTNMITGLLIIGAFYVAGSWLAVYPLGRLLQANLNLIQVNNLSLTTDLALAGLFFFITVYKVRNS
jgi:hypothetical protein